MTTRILIADDQALVRAGVRLLVETQDDMSVIGEAADGLDAVEQAGRLTPDVILMDIRMPRLDGIEATRQLVRSGNPAKVVMLTTFDLDEYLLQSLRTGASGFLVKHARPEEVLFGIRAAVTGDALISPTLTGRLVERFVRPATTADARIDRLTSREREILDLVVRGQSNAEIAARLVVGESTVKTHVARVMTKLGLRNRTHAVIYAYETGLVTPGDPGPPPP